MGDVDSRRIEEVTYLNTENTWRYRAIVHFCFRRHEHMQAYIYPEDIWQALQKQPQFKDYTQEQMDQDLSQLVAWHNLQAFQETGRALSIVDFKRKMLRYQCTPYTVEIERLVEKLKKIGNEFGGSLETTQFDRIRDSLEKLLQYEQADDKELYQNWQDLQHYFRTLVQNTSDYMAHLGSQRVQERMKTSEFIIYKDKFTQYLNSFVLGLQRSSLLLEKLFNQLEPEQERILFLRLAARQAEIQVTGAEFSQKECRDDFAESYEVMREWFLGREGRESELSHLIRETGETIRRITTHYPHWYGLAFRKYADNEDALPFDQHELLALIAPRPLYVESGSEDLWSDPYGEYLSLVEAGKVYQLYGYESFTDTALPPVETPQVRGVNGHHIRAGRHDITLYDWQQYIPFAEKFL